MSRQDKFNENKENLLFEQLMHGVLDSVNFNSKLLRDSTINIIGSGHQGKRLTEELAYLIKEPRSRIKKVNVWFKKKESVNLSDDLSNRFNFLLTSDRNSQYEQIMDTIRFKEFTNLDSLSEITKNAIDDEKNADLLVVASRYNFDSLFNGEVPKSLNELKQLKESSIINLIQTSILGAPYSYSGCLDIAQGIQKRRVLLKELIENFQHSRGISKRRLGMLENNIIGITELGKTINGYPGTAINIVNDLNITNYDLAAEAEIPINRIIGPAMNDSARLHVALRTEYYEHYGKKFVGNISIPSVSGPHGIGMSFERDKIMFGDQYFNNVFGKYSDEIYASLKDKVHKYGILFVKNHGKTSIDTVYNSLLPVINSLLTEESNTLHRGTVFNEDFNAFTGLNFRVQRGTVIVDAAKISDSSEEVLSEFVDNTKTVQELTQLLVDEGHFSKLKCNKAPILDVIEIEREEKISDILCDDFEIPSSYNIPWIYKKVAQAEEILVNVKGKLSEASEKKRVKTELKELNRIKEKTEELRNKLTQSLNTEIYFMSTVDKRAFVKASFDHRLSPALSKFKLDLEGKVEGSKLDYEHERLSLVDFVINNNKVYALSERITHANKPIIRRVFVYDSKNKLLNSKKVISEERDFEIEDFAISNQGEVYFIKSNDKGNSIESLNLNTGLLTKLSDIDSDMNSLISYKDKLILTSPMSFYVYDQGKLGEVYKSDKKIIGKTRVLEKEGILFYGSENKNKICAWDIEKDSLTSFDTRFRTFDFLSSNEGIQIATLNEKGILINNYKNKKRLFNNNGDKYQLDKLILNDGKIWIPQKDILLVTKEPNEFYALYHEKGNNEQGDFFIQEVNNITDFSTSSSGLKNGHNK